MPPSTPYTIPTNEKKAKSWFFWLIIGLIGLVLAGVVTVFFTVIAPKLAEEAKVKDELITQNLRLKANSNEGVLDPASIAGIDSTDRATIRLIVGTNQKDYCIQATSLSRPEEVHYHMTQSTPDQSPVSGECGDSATEVPAQPQGVSVGSVGGTTAALTWTALPDAKEYIIQCSVSDTFNSPIESKKGNVPAMTIEGLAESTRYHCRVGAFNSIGASEWSEIVTIQTNVVAQVPKNLSVQTLSSTSLSYQWDSVPGATQYVLEYSTDASFVNNVTKVVTTQTKGEAKGLEVYTGYFFHVKAVTPGFGEKLAPFSPIVQGRTSE